MREARTEDMGYWGAANRYVGDVTDGVLITTVIDAPFPIRLTPMTATCRVPPLSRVKLGIGWSRGVARDAEQ